MKVDREVSFEQSIAKFEQKIESAEGKKSEIEKLVNQFADKIDTNLDLCKLSNTRLLSAFSKIKHMTETSASLPIQSKVQKTFDKIIQSQQEGFKEELRVFIDRIKDEKGMTPSALGSLNLEADINNLAQELKELLQTRENIDLLMQFGHEALLQDILFVCSLEPESDIARMMIRSCCEHDNPDAVRALVAQGVKIHEIAAAISIDAPKTKVTECIRKMVAESGGKIRSKKMAATNQNILSTPGKAKGKTTKVVEETVGKFSKTTKKYIETPNTVIKDLDEHGYAPESAVNLSKTFKPIIKNIKLINKSGGFVKALLIALSKNPKLKNELERLGKEKQDLEMKIKDRPEETQELLRQLETVEANIEALTNQAVIQQGGQSLDVLEKGIGLTQEVMKYVEIDEQYLAAFKTFSLVSTISASVQNFIGCGDARVKAQHINQVMGQLQIAKNELVQLRNQYSVGSALHTLVGLKVSQFNQQLQELQTEKQNMLRKGYCLAGAGALGVASVCFLATAAGMYGFKTDKEEQNAEKLQQAEYALLMAGWGLGLVAEHLPALAKGDTSGVEGEIVERTVGKTGRLLYESAKESTMVSGFFKGAKERVMTMMGKASVKTLLDEKKELVSQQNYLEKEWMNGDRSEKTLNEISRIRDRLAEIKPQTDRLEMANKLGITESDLDERLKIIQKELADDSQNEFLMDFLEAAGIDATLLKADPLKAIAVLVSP